MYHWIKCLFVLFVLELTENLSFSFFHFNFSYLQKILDSIDIGCLYKKVLENYMYQYNIAESAVKFGIECMKHVYNGDKNLKIERSQVADYTDPAHCCAYLHKYATLHTTMVCDILDEAVNTNINLFGHQSQII